METKVADILKKVGYPGVDEALVKEAIKDGPKSVDYTRLVEWLSKELSLLCSLEDHVNAITTQDDSSSFLLELSGFLKGIGCQYKSLTEGHVNERLQSVKDRLLLLDYLATELAAAKILTTNCPESNSMLITLNESSTARDLKNLLSALSVSVPDDLSPEKLFLDVQKKIEEVLKNVPKTLIDKPFFTGEITNEQWERLAELLSELEAEYKIRREMLLKRLDVTIQSFLWSERMVGKEEKIATVYYPKRQKLSAVPSVELADILAAREDLAVIEKTSSINVRKRTQSSVNKVVIGQVPDRGGRPSEQQPPPPEMPSWTQRSSGGGGFSGGRGGRGGQGFGGRGRGGGGGGWNRDNNRGRDDRKSSHDDRHKNKHNDSRGYYLSERDRNNRR